MWPIAISLPCSLIGCFVPLVVSLLRCPLACIGRALSRGLLFGRLLVLVVVVVPLMLIRDWADHWMEDRSRWIE